MNLSIQTYCTISNKSIKVNGLEITNYSYQTQDLLKELYQHLSIDYAKFYKMDNISKLGILGVELLKNADHSLSDLKDDELGIILQTEKGCLESDINHQARVDEKSPSPAIFVYTLSNIVIGEISIRNKWFGESILFIEKETDLENIIRHSSSLLMSKKSQKCLIGTIDSFKNEHNLKLAIIDKSGTGPEFTEENLKHIFEN